MIIDRKTLRPLKPAMAKTQGGLASLMQKPPKPKISWQKKLFQACSLHVGLVLLCLIYVFFGAKVFIALEGPYETRIREETHAKVEEEINKFLDGVEMIMEAFPLDDPLYNKTIQILLDDYTKEMFMLFKHPVSANVFDGDTYLNGSYQEQWTEPGALLFASTTVVPVGFGLITPLTRAGRLFLCAYAFFGIPLALTTLSDFGKFFCNFTFKFFKENASLYMICLLLLLVSYPVFGGVVMAFFSSLSLLDAIYYCSITIFTIGFGDISPPIPIPALVLFVVVGVTLVTVSVDVVAANAIHHIHYLGRQVGHARIIAGKMIAMAQSLNINRGLGLGMAQLGAFARFGVMMKLDGNHPQSLLHPIEVGEMRRKLTSSFDPEINVDFVDDKTDWKEYADDDGYDEVFENSDDEMIQFVDA